MDIFKSLKFYIYTMIASAVMTFAAHHPSVFPHDLAIWLLGVIGHAIGVGSTNGSQPKV